ncbi:hypothetical protein B0H14DRAFT_2609116 [Mycena olivaceomarginata]|nr:hypothetical protein B0H14DRAFT_2609116 [Mycena olivaceomarginata]
MYSSWWEAVISAGKSGWGAPGSSLNPGFKNVVVIWNFQLVFPRRHIGGLVISIVSLFLVGAKAIFINDTLKGNDLVGQAFNPGPPDLTFASWIWTTTSGVTGILPGSSAFRLTFHPSPNFPLANITVAISIDNAYSLYFNNTLVGNSVDWTAPNVWTICNVPSNGPWVFAIMATNYPDGTLGNPAGVIASFCASNDAQQAFYSCILGRSQLQRLHLCAVIEAPYGSGPWGRLPAPVPKSL